MQRNITITLSSQHGSPCPPPTPQNRIHIKCLPGELFEWVLRQCLQIYGTQNPKIWVRVNYDFGGKMGKRFLTTGEQG